MKIAASASIKPSGASAKQSSVSVHQPSIKQKPSVGSYQSMKYPAEPEQGRFSRKSHNIWK